MIGQEIGNVGVVGAGVMGTGMMINTVMHGRKVVICDQSPEALASARDRLGAYLSRQIEKGRIESAFAQEARQRVTFVDDISKLSQADLVIEAVFERLELKRHVFVELEKVVGTEVILASKTSCLRLSEITEAIDRPERFCGMHYFSPAEINPVVELIEGHRTTHSVLSAARSFLESSGKVVIDCRDQNGFALNRFFCPYSNEAVRLLDENLATTGQIDQVARETFGVALGPFAVMNIIGTGTNLNAVQNLAPLGPFYRAAEGLIAQGRERLPWQINTQTDNLTAANKAEIAERLIASVLLPVLEILGEGTATMDAIDKGARLAFRFEKTPGMLIKRLGSDAVDRMVRALAERHSHSHSLASTRALSEELR